MLMEDEALQLLAAKLSIEGLLNLRNAVQHVPKNIPRVVNGVSLRSTFMFTTYVKFVETYCPIFLSEKKDGDNLWKLTQTKDLPYNKFLTPPVATCFQCQKDLTLRNNPSKAKLFTLDGPIPCTKITLECRPCSHVYGICNYSDKSGSHYYPKSDVLFNIDVIEVSNVTYFDVKLYK